MSVEAVVELRHGDEPHDDRDERGDPGGVDGPPAPGGTAAADQAGGRHIHASAAPTRKPDARASVA